MNRTTLRYAGLILIGAIGGGMLVGWWVFSSIDARLLLSNQAASVIIPKPVNVTADVLNNLDIEIDDAITTTVPIDQVIQIPIKDTLHVMASFDNEIPIKLNVPVRDKITIDQVLDVDTVIKADLLGDTHDLPIRGKIPVKAVVPISLNIPVDQLVHLKFNAPADVRIIQPLEVPLKANIAATIPIRSQMSVPVKSALQAAVTVTEPADIVITNANLRLPLRTLKLQMKSDEAAANAGAKEPAK